MPNFAFIARDATGRTQAQTMLAATMGELVGELRGRGWIVLDVKEAGRDRAVGAHLLAWLSPRWWLPATSLDVEVGLQQLAIMIHSGLNLLSALRAASEQARRPAMSRIWNRVAERIMEGSSFADALSVERRQFSSLVIQLVRMGEASGTLDVVLARAAEHLERARSARTTVLTAMMYPAFVLLASLTVTTFMLVSVIPKLRTFIVSRGHKLPAVTQALLDCSVWLRDWGPVILLTAAAVLVTAYLTYRSVRGRLAMDRMILRVPVIGGLLRLSGTAALARGLGLLLESSITLLDALGVAMEVVSNRAMCRRVETAREAVLRGRSFGDALRGGQEFLPMLSQMVSVGEATGHLDLVLNNVASFHEKQLAATVRRFSALIEPVIIVIVGSIVGFVYIAFFLALFSVGGSVR